MNLSLLHRAILEILISLFVVSILAVSFFLAKKCSQKTTKKMSSDNFIIRAPRINLWAGIIACIIGLVLVWGSLRYPDFFLDKEGDTIPYVLSGILLFCGAFLVLLYFRKTIHVYKDSIFVQPLLGRKKEYAFSEITNVKIQPMEIEFITKMSIMNAFVGTRSVIKITNFYSGYQLLVGKFIEERGLRLSD
jgi:ABC-type Fe3+ transport system permease subunit